VTLTAAEVNSGLILHSYYGGSGHPVATLSVTATGSTSGTSASSAPQIVTVTDPPAAASNISQSVALLTQYLAGGFSDQTDHAHVTTQSSMTGWHDELFLSKPQH
jgi:hypothetical protein